MSTETITLIRDGKKGVWRLGKREILHCHHQNDFCIKMGSSESHFNVSVGSDGQSHRTASTNHSLFEEKGEPKRYRNRSPSAYQPNALPLGRTALWSFDTLEYRLPGLVSPSRYTVYHNNQHEKDVFMPWWRKSKCNESLRSLV